MKVEHVLSIQNQLGEGPLWNSDEGALYWVDILADCYYRLEPGSDQPERFAVGSPVGCLGFRAKGGLVLATKAGFAFWEPATEKTQSIADPEADLAETRFNDGAVDPQGRFWAGTIGREQGCALYRLDPDLSYIRWKRGLQSPTA